MNKSKTLYLECTSGISGDMTVAALLDLDAEETVLRDGLKSLNVSGYQVEISRVKKCGIDMCDFHVILDEKHQEHPVGEYESEEHSHVHSHAQEGGHSNQHSHKLEAEFLEKEHQHEVNEHALHKHDIQEHVSHEHHMHIHLGTHEHRNVTDIQKIIEKSDISPKAKQTANRIFEIIAEAETKAHGVPLDEVHFHEVGAVDSIVDIVAVSICLDNLGIETVYTSTLTEGSGQIPCQHGILPVPVPAVVNIMTKHQLPMQISEIKGELITPTGAAIVAAISCKKTLSSQFTVQKIGMGAGKRKYERPSFLRAMLIEEGNEEEEEIYVLETNLDDCTPEALSFTMEQLFSKNACDVFYQPIYMKKNRPSYLLQVICMEDDKSELEQIIFKHTTSIGIRYQKMKRRILQREFTKVNTKYGLAHVKVCKTNDSTYYYPEYESVKELCEQSNRSFQEIFSLIQKIAEDNHQQ